MKKWTKKFINGKVNWQNGQNFLFDNAKYAEKKLGIDKNLWIDLWETNNLIESIREKNIEEAYYIAFAAGIAVGFAECNKKIK